MANELARTLEHVQGMEEAEQAQFLRDLIYLRNTGKKPQRWLEVRRDHH